MLIQQSKCIIFKEISILHCTIFEVWNILDGTCIHTFAGPNKHSSAVTGLRFLDNGFVATSGDDGFVKLWDVKDGNSNTFKGFIQSSPTPSRQL